MYLKNVVIPLTDFFQNYVDTSKSAYGINPIYSLSTPSFTYKAGLKNPGVHLDFLTDDKLRLLLDYDMRGGHSYRKCNNRHVKWEGRKVVYEIMTKLYVLSMSELLLSGDFQGNWFYKKKWN